MDRLTELGLIEAETSAAVDQNETQTNADEGNLRAPARREIIELPANPETLAAIIGLIQKEGATANFTGLGELAIRFQNGGLIVLSGTAGLAAILGAKEGDLLAALNASTSAFVDLLEQLKSGVGEELPSASPGGIGGDSRWNSNVRGESNILGEQSGSTYDESPAQVRLGGQMESLSGLEEETARWGRDDLKRGEAGERGQFVTTETGEPIMHLVGLGDEEIGRRNGEKLVSSDNVVMGSVDAAVGSGVDHLWLLGDFEFQRASRDLNDGEDVFETKGDNPKIWTPLDPIDAFLAIEDTPNSGYLFDPAVALLPVEERSVRMDPRFGSVTLGPDGRYDYTPAPGFSGHASFTYTFTDPRNGKTVTGSVSITVEAVADPASISGRAATPEDTLVATPITVTLNDPDGSEEIERVVITGLPAGATLDWNHALPGSIVRLPNGAFVVTGSTEDIQALLKSLNITPPHDFHGRISLDVAVTTIERNVPSALPGYLDREVTHFTYVVDVEAVADPVTATGDTETTDEDVAVHLNDLAATFGDSLDGSETHIVEIRGVDPDARMQNALGVEYPYVIALDGTKTYRIDLAAVGRVYFLPPPDESGTFAGMTIVAIATEGSNGDREIATAPITVLVNPVADPLEIQAPTQATDEDTPVTFGDDIAITVLDPSTQTVTEVIVSGFPAGTIVTYVPVGGGPLVTVTMGAGGSVTFNGGTEADIRAALATLTLTPPLHTDQNITLTITATTEDLGGVTDTQSVPMTITVAAVADGPTISGNAEGNEDALIDLPIITSRIDADGSESYKSAAISIPAGGTLIYPGVLPHGITVAVVGPVTIFTPGPTTTAAQFESFLAAGLQVQASADSDVNFDVIVTVTTIESVLSGGEVSLLEKDDSITIPVVVHPVIDMPAVSGASTVDEDASVTFGANIAITDNDKADGSEAITQIVLGNIPSSAAVSYVTFGTVTVTPVTGGGLTTYTITGGTEDEIRDTLASFSLIPDLHTDANIAVSVAITKVDQTTAEGEAAVTTTDTHTHVITVNAVADGPSLSGSASGNEDAPIALPVTVSRIDADGSEQYDFATITPPAGVTLIYPGVLPAGITVSVVGGAHTFTPGPATTAAQFESFLATGLQVQAPHDSDVNFDVSVTVGTIESVLTDTGLTLLRKDDTITVPVTVHPVIDAPVISGSSAVNEDGIVNPSNQAVTAGVNVGANIAITAPDGSDGSEAITQVVVTGLPIGAVVTYTPVGGSSTTYTVAAGTTSITLNGGTDAEIRAALATLTLTPPPHSDVDIVLGLAVTKSDATGTESEAAATQTFNATHTITVAAVADIPTGSGSGAGNEDQNIPVSISVGHADSSDGSETIKNVIIGNIPAGLSLSEASAGAGVLTLNGDGTYTVTGPSDAAINDVLANLTLVFAPGGARQHLDTEFNLSVTVTTIESAVGATQNALPEASSTFNVPITVTAVADPVTPTGASVIEEDVAETIGSNIAFTKVDADGTEAVTTVVVSGFPAGTSVTYTPVGGGAPVSFLSTGPNVITLTGGTEAEIRTALDSLNVTASLHSDVNFALNVAVTTTDNDASTYTTNFTHAVTVQAVADAPTFSGSGAGLEDQNIAVSMTVGHPDSSDGTERIKNVVIGNIPAGLSLSETSLGAGVLTLNGDGTYTVTGPNDAAINDLLANLTLVFAPGGARQHLDTDFNLSVTVTTIESAPSEGGAGEVSVLEASQTFSAPVTVTAVADGVTQSGSSTIVEDVAATIGSNISYARIDNDGTESVSKVDVSGFPVGSTVTYNDVGGAPHTVLVAAGGLAISFTGGTEAEIRSALDSLNVTAPLNSDTNFSLDVAVTTDDNDGSSITNNYTHTVVVQAVADAPSVSADAISLNEDASSTLVIRPDRSADGDNSETLSVRITVPSDGSGAVGTLSGTVPGGVTFTNLGGGVYTVTAAGADPATRETLLDGFLNGGVTFTPRAEWSGVLTGTNGIKVEAISTEAATAGELAPNAYGGVDGTSEIETATTYIDVTVIPVNDMPVQTNSATTVQENNNSSATTDPDLIIPIGTRIGLTIADTDGSQGLSLTLTGFPTNAQALAFGTSLAGVTTSVNIATGTVTISGANANQVITVLNSLSVTLADDRDQNFTVAINGTVTDSNGVTVDSDPVSLTHTVTVQAVADTPTVDVGAATKAFVNEDSDYVTYPVTTGLNDTDTSETYQSVVVEYSTLGTGTQPLIQFGVTAGVVFDNSVPGRVTLTGAAADIDAAMASLQVKPGVHNDADITIRVTATAIESNPAEDNNGAGAGMGGGAVGAEIAVPTAQATQTFVIPVAAVADAPTGSGSGAGFEDAILNVSITVSHADTADGSERLKNVVIADIPAGLTLSENSAGAGSLALNGDGTYTVTGPNDAAIGDVLANLRLIPIGGGARQHLDTDFNLSVTVTTIESATSESGAGQGVNNEAALTFSVPVTVTAMVDGVTLSGSSVIVEDVAKTIGSDIAYTRIDNDGSEAVTSVIVTSFPTGSTVTYTDVGGAPHTVLVGGAGLVIDFTGGTEAQIRTALNTLNVTPPLNSDANFNLTVAVTTLDNDASAVTQAYVHNVVVQGVADAPSVSADAISLNEDASSTLVIRPDRSADNDNSESLSVRITVPSDGLGPVGTIMGIPPAGVSIINGGSGVYTVIALGADPASREALLDGFLNGGLTFIPRSQWSGVLSGTSGIRVEAISTEDAIAGELAAGTYGGVDGTSKTETATTYIDVTVAPVTDLPLQINTTTVVSENAGSSATTDPDLIIPIGTRIGLTMVDTDGSQGLSLTLTGFPTNAQAMAFGSSLAGVTTSVDIPTGTVTISGANGNDVLTVLRTLSVTLADDRDQNFTVAINGTVTDSNGVTVDTDPVSLSHAVTVRAVADNPTVDVGAATKAAIDEDSGYVTYPVTTALNDTDGSETYQQVVVQFSTPGTGNRPEVNFTVTAGVTFNTSVAGQVTLTGAAADIDAAMASLQVRPGADNGEDISVTVTATAVESNPAEDNNGAGAGMGGGVFGAEIFTPTAVTVAAFVIPVNPVPEVPILTLPVNPTGSEDTTFALGAITVAAGSSDPDGSETRFIEIDTTSYPTGTQFFNGATPVGTVVTPGWLRVTEAQLATLSIQGPLHMSGPINLSIRGVIVDTSMSGSITSVTAAQSLLITVTPDADAVTPPAQSTGVEDIANIAVGADLANATTGIRVVDDGTGGGNNAATETLSKIALDFPADTATQTYGVTQGALVGSAQIAFDGGTRTYTITSTIITSAADVGLLSQADRAQAEADIRATLAGFTVTMGPTHSDLNGAISVTATTLDVNGGLANTQDNTFSHTIVVQAVADTPTVSVVDPVSSSPEESAGILLTINPGNSADIDDSETLSVRITIPSDGLGPVGTITGSPPADITVTDQGGGVYLVTAVAPTNAMREFVLDSYLNGGGIAFTPRNNWSGHLTGSNGIRVDVISTEAATGGELAPGAYGGPDGTSATETVTDYIDVYVAPIADAPTVKGNGIGLEDTLIPIPMSVTLADKDGSETYVMRITSGVPSGAHIYGAGGVEILPDGSGHYNLSPADVSALTLRPPLNYSSAVQGDIVLVTQTVVTDTSGGGTVVTSFTNNIPVAVTGVADQPGTRTVTVTGDEDQPIELGAAIVASAGGSLNNLLLDTDGSEALSFVIGGLPAGVIPTSSVPGGVTYIGSGTWSVTAAAMADLELPPVPNFSGENPYSGVTVRAVTQEMDGDQATSAQWPVTIAINPVISASTVDGFSSWSMGVQQAEGVTEAAGSISLAAATNQVFIDNDGSESVVSYTFDLSNLISNAGIAVQLAALPGAGSGLDKLAANYLSGVFTYDSGAGTITVQAANIGGVALSGSLFLDSNQDFSIPVSALVRDTAIIGGSPVSVDKTEVGTFTVDLVGTADTPTAVATGASGSSGVEMPITLGGVSTDTDAGLGRTPSEDIYYIVTVLNPGTAPALGFTDGAGNIVGLDNGDGTWLLTPADLVNLHVTTPGGSAGTANLKLTTIATENDGDVASASANFNVVVTSQPGGGGPPPLPPSVTIGASNGNEDGSVTLNVTAAPAPGDTSNPSVAVMISNVPAGAEVIGARFNPETGRWVATAAAVNAGLVRIIPPDDFSGTMNVTIEAVATNASLLKASTGATTAPFEIDPVADGVLIAAAPGVAAEDAPISLNITLTERDIDGSESIGGFVYLSLNNGATLLGGYPVVAGGDADATYGATSVVGYYRVPVADVPTLQIQSASQWHGTVDVTVAAFSIDPEPTLDADDTLMEEAIFQVVIPAVADAPIVGVPVSVNGTEDTPIALPGLSAVLADSNPANGPEVLSVKIENVPFGSTFNAGSNNGDGSWTIPLSALATLSITPPLNYSGTMTLTLTAIALELSNGDEAQTSMSFDVIVAPKADAVELLADNVAIDATASVMLDLNIRMADLTGVSPGENAPESIEITFSAVPTSVSLSSTLGGSMSNPSSGVWVFTGTEAEANAILASAGPGATGGVYTIAVSAVTDDAGNTLASPVLDTFQLTVPSVLTGNGSANTLTGSAVTDLLFGLGGNDTLDGGAGADHLNGGNGSDTFVVDDVGDVVVDSSGTDTVQTVLASYSLGADIENLTYIGAGSFAGTGNSLANIMLGGTGADTLRGGLGADTMTGGGAADRFAYGSGDLGGGVDTVTDFANGAGGDALDIAAILVGFNPATSILTDFVQVTEAAGNSTIRVDSDGGGNSFQDLVVLQGVAGLDVNAMRTNGNLIV